MIRTFQNIETALDRIEDYTMKQGCDIYIVLVRFGDRVGINSPDLYNGMEYSFRKAHEITDPFHESVLFVQEYRKKKHKRKTRNSNKLKVLTLSFWPSPQQLLIYL